MLQGAVKKDWNLQGMILCAYLTWVNIKWVGKYLQTYQQCAYINKNGSELTNAWKPFIPDKRMKIYSFQ